MIREIRGLVFTGAVVFGTAALFGVASGKLLAAIAVGSMVRLAWVGLCKWASSISFVW